MQEFTLRMLFNTVQYTVSHPLEASYRCLPNPPFASDPMQLKAIGVLSKVFDEVMVARDQPVPPMQKPPAAPQASKAQTPMSSLNALFWGGSRKAREEPKTQQKPKEFIPVPCAPKGLYLYGGCGCGKTLM